MQNLKSYGPIPILETICILLISAVWDWLNTLHKTKMLLNTWITWENHKQYLKEESYGGCV